MKPVIVAVGCLVASTLVAAQSSATPDISSLRETVDAVATASLKKHGVPAVRVAYIANGRVQWSAVYGEQAPGVPATSKTLFNIASMMRPVTAEVVLRLASQQALSLDEEISDTWIDPDIANDPRKPLLTPRIMLQHRTGFPNWRRETGGKLAFRFDPGTATGYSGEGYDYLAHFIEKKTGRDFVTLAGELVFVPVGMSDATFVPQGELKSRIAQPKGPAGEWGTPDFSTPWSAADNLYSTVDGYARFVAAVMTNTGVSSRIAAIRHAVVDNQIRGGCPLAPEHCPKSVGFGLGWEVLDYGSDQVIRHTGSDWGERAIGYFVPARGVGAVILTSGANGKKVILDTSAVLFDFPSFNALLQLQAQ